MRTSFLTAAAASLLLFVACDKQVASYTVSGTFPDSTLNGQTIYILDANADRNKIDSTIVTGNTFVFKGKRDTASYVAVQAGRNIAQFILENGEIQIDMSKPTQPSGTPLNEAFSQLLQANDSLRNVLYAAFDKYKETASSEEEFAKFRTEYYENQWKKTYADKIKEFYTAHPNDDIGTFSVQMLGMVLNDEEMDALVSGSSEFLRSRGIVKKIESKLTAKKTTKEGMPFVDFTIEQEDGSKVSLSDYVGKGKYTLVDFWASWCGPCRAEMPTLSEVYNQYKDKGVEVLSIGVWEEPEATRKGIADLNMSWPQIVNAQDIPSSKYGFDGIPHIILFGPDGTIVARDLRGEALKAKIKEVTQKN